MAKISDIIIRVRYEGGQFKAEMVSDLEAARQRTDALSTSAANMREGWTAVGLASGVALAGITAGIVKAVSESAKMETARLRLEQLKGSAEAGAEAFRKLVEFSAGTPFTLPDIVEAASTLEAFGASAENDIGMIGDLAVFMGVTIPEAAEAFGRAFASGAGAADIFRERGILNVIKEAEGIEDLTKLTLPEFREAMYDAFTDPEGRIAGGTEKLAGTLEGRWSTLTDSMTLALAQVGDNLAPVISKAIELIIPLLEAVRELAAEYPGLTAGVAGSTMALLLMTTAMSGVALVLPKIIAGMRALQLSMGPTGWVILGLSIAAGLLVSYAAKSDEAAESAERMAAEQEKLNEALKAGNILAMEKAMIRYRAELRNNELALQGLKEIFDKYADSTSLLDFGKASNAAVEIGKAEKEIENLKILMTEAEQKKQELLSGKGGKGDEKARREEIRNEAERLLQIELKQAETNEGRIGLLQEIVNLKRNELAAAAPGTEAELKAKEELVDAELDLAEAVERRGESEAEANAKAAADAAKAEELAYRRVDLEVRQAGTDEAKIGVLERIIALREAELAETIPGTEEEIAAQEKLLAAEEALANEKIAISNRERDAKRADMEVLYAANETFWQNTLDLEMHGRDKWKAMGRAALQVELQNISKQTMAYIMGDKVKEKSAIMTAGKIAAVESWEFAVSMGKTIAQLAAKVYKFYAGLGPWGIPLAAATVAMMIAAIRAVKFEKGGLVNGATLALLGEAGPELVMPEKTFNEDLLPEIKRQIAMQVNLGLTGGGSQSTVNNTENRQITHITYQVNLEGNVLGDEEQMTQMMRNVMRRAGERQGMK